MGKHPFAEAAHADAWARLTRRGFRGLVVAAIGTALGLDRVTGAAAPCRRKSDRCDRGDQCCSNRCRRGFCYPRRR